MDKAKKRKPIRHHIIQPRTDDYKTTDLNTGMKFQLYWPPTQSWSKAQIIHNWGDGSYVIKCNDDIEDPLTYYIDEYKYKIINDAEDKPARKRRKTQIKQTTKDIQAIQSLMRKKKLIKQQLLTLDRDIYLLTTKETIKHALKEQLCNICFASITMEHEDETQISGVNCVNCSKAICLECIKNDAGTACAGCGWHPAKPLCEPCYDEIYPLTDQDDDDAYDDETDQEKVFCCRCQD